MKKATPVEATFARIAGEALGRFYAASDRLERERAKDRGAYGSPQYIDARMDWSDALGALHGARTAWFDVRHAISELGFLELDAQRERELARGRRVSL